MMTRIPPSSAQAARVRPSTAPAHRQPTPGLRSAAAHADSILRHHPPSRHTPNHGVSRDRSHSLTLPPAAAPKTPLARQGRPSPSDRRSSLMTGKSNSSAHTSSPGSDEPQAPAPRRSLNGFNGGTRPMSAPPTVRRYELPPRLPAEEEARLRQLFHEMDSNGDGAIDEHQLRHILRELGRYRGERALANFVRNADRKGRGLVELRELIHILSIEHNEQSIALPCVIPSSTDTPVSNNPKTLLKAAVREAQVDRIMDEYAARSLFETIAEVPSNGADNGVTRRNGANAATTAPDGAEVEMGAQSIPSGAIETLLREMFEIEVDTPIAPVASTSLFQTGSRNRDLRLADVEDLLLSTQ